MSGALPRRQRPSAFGVAVASVFVAMFAVAPVVHAAPALTFGATIGSCSVFGGAEVDSHMRIDVLDHHGVRKARAHVVTDLSGFWNTGCLPHFRIQPRDEVEAYTNGNLLRLWALPRFNVVVDRVTDRAKGNGPTNDDVVLDVQECFPGGITCENLLEQTIHTSATGAFNVPLLDGGVTPWDAIGYQHVQLYWISADGDELFLTQRVPYVQATAGSAVVSGQGAIGARQTITLRSSGGQLRATASATGSASDGSWTATLKSHGSPVKVKLGDTLHGSFAADASLKVRTISVHVDLVTHLLSGTCFPNALAGVRITSSQSSAIAEAWGTTGPQGELSTLNTSNLQLVEKNKGWTIDLYCGTSHGDVLHRRQVVP